MTGPRASSRFKTAILAVPSAVEFLTPVRIHAGGPLPDEAVGASSAFFPLVGLLLGLMLVGADHLLSAVLPATVADALLVCLLAGAGGLLHLDGLADTADGVLGGRTPERRLEIMRDSRIGAFGAAALVLVLLLQWTSVGGLVSPWRRPALLLFPAMGRAAMVAAIAAFPYARSQGLGVLFRRHVWPWPMPVAMIIALALAVVCFGVSGIALWGVMLLSAIVLGLLFTSRLGGLTGDTYGAICELTQVLVLLLILSTHRTGWLAAGLVKG